MVGWEKHRGDSFDFRQRLGHLYHWDSSDVMLYDNFDPQHRVARLETAEGEIVGNRARTSLVWQCTSDGWRIVREHTSTRRVSREEIDAIVPHPND
ncbi:hypothetical protein [Billgrantia endophytica]|uniref:SnoaL-like domain-containing protein n=1 Tax=Billgrantia endophytica TaxID=2033802 RepID=A0A2N7U0Y5_9GAMM|nr:hypothetical protein [Halomonas endophytica]PMR74082.1 hypothetical protein C1H69_14945 [Halomonas endophytica]